MGLWISKSIRQEPNVFESSRFLSQVKILVRQIALLVFSVGLWFFFVSCDVNCLRSFLFGYYLQGTKELRILATNAADHSINVVYSCSIKCEGFICETLGVFNPVYM
jgi:hypothetical protein